MYPEQDPAIQNRNPGAWFWGKESFIICLVNGRPGVKRATPFLLIPLVAFLNVASLAQEQTPSPVAQETYWPTHGWRSSTPEAQGMDSEALARAFRVKPKSEILLMPPLPPKTYQSPSRRTLWRRRRWSKCRTPCAASKMVLMANAPPGSAD